MQGLNEVFLGVQEMKKWGINIANNNKDKILTFFCEANINLSCK